MHFDLWLMLANYDATGAIETIPIRHTKNTDSAESVVYADGVDLSAMRANVGAANYNFRGFTFQWALLPFCAQFALLVSQ
jgi:hypothetical protein